MESKDDQSMEGEAKPLVEKSTDFKHQEETKLMENKADVNFFDDEEDFSEQKFVFVIKLT